MAKEIQTPIDSRKGVQRVAIIGTGAVGSAFAFTMIQEGHARELVLVDKDIRRAEGEMMDLSHCLPYGRPMKIEVGDLDEAAGCDMVLITAGAAQKPGETRIDLVKRNAEIYSEFFPRLNKANPGAIFVIITNPVDIMTRLSLKLSGLPSEQVFGTGTVLDTARFRLLLSHYFDVDPRSTHSYVIGEHGDSEVLVWSRAAIGPYDVEDYGKAIGKELTPDAQQEIEKDVITAAYQIIERKGGTNFAIGISTLRIFEAINYNQSRLATVTRNLDGAYGLDGVCLSLPCLLLRDGVKKPMELPLAESEKKALMESAEKLDEVYQHLGAD